MEIKGKVWCLDNEEWRDIKGYEGLYQVSDLGRIRCLEKVVYAGRGLRPKVRKAKIMNIYKDIGGYLYVRLSKYNISKCFKVHRLVANSFLQNPYELPFINHIDENKTNNRLSNLEWCTAKYNLNYGNRSRKYSKPVNMICPICGNIIRTFDNISSAEQFINISHGKISSVCQGKRKSAGGYRWRYKKI